MQAGSVSEQGKLAMEDPEQGHENDTLCMACIHVTLC